jgi:hypothetical protein
VPQIIASRTCVEAAGKYTIVIDGALRVEHERGEG